MHKIYYNEFCVQFIDKINNSIIDKHKLKSFQAVQIEK